MSGLSHPALKEEGGEMFMLLIYSEFQTCEEQFLALVDRNLSNSFIQDRFYLK